MRRIFVAALVLTLLAIGLVPVLAEGGETTQNPGTPPETTTSSDAKRAADTISETTKPSDSITSEHAAVATTAPSSNQDRDAETEKTLETGIDGPPLIVNGDATSPDLICAGVDGAVVFVDDDTRYIAGFEGEPFLRVILSDGEVMETSDVTLTDDPSGAYARGILEGEFAELAITMYLDDDLIPCPELSGGDDQPPDETTATTQLSNTTPPETIDGSPLVVNGQAIHPELICAGVDGAVVFIDDDSTRYIAGFEGGPFLRVILSDGEVMETSDVTLTDDPSGAYARGILKGEFPEVVVTMYLEDDPTPCPELR